MLGDDNPAMRARVLGVLAFYRANSEGDGIAVLPMMEEATRLAREVGDPEAIVRCLVGELAMYTAHPDLERQRVLVEEIAAIAMLTPDFREQYISLHFLERQRVLTGIQSGDIAAAKRASATAQVLEVEHNQDTGFVPMWDGVFALMEGRIDDAEEANTRLAGHANDVNFANSWAAQLFQVRREQGRVAELLPILDGLVASTPGLVAMRTVYALALADVGEFDRAKAILDDLTGDGLATIPTDTTWSSSLAYLAEVAAALGDAAAARVTARTPRPVRRPVARARMGRRLPRRRRPVPGDARQRARRPRSCSDGVRRRVGAGGSGRSNGTGGAHPAVAGAAGRRAGMTPETAIQSRP